MNQPSGAALTTAIVSTTDMAALVDFYAAALDLGAPAHEQERHRGWDLPGAYFGIDRVDVVAGQAPGGVSLWFTVDDLDATFDWCVALGASVKYPPTDKPWGARLAAVHDPDGNLLGLSQRRS